MNLLITALAMNIVVGLEKHLDITRSVTGMIYDLSDYGSDKLFGEKGIKALVGMIHFYETNAPDELGQLYGSIGHDLNGRHDEDMLPRSSSYIQWFIDNPEIGNELVDGFENMPKFKGYSLVAKIDMEGVA